MLSCAGADRLSTGMRHSYGKPFGRAARVEIGSVIVSVRSKDANAHHVIEALRRAKYKFPGTQQILQSTKWGFTQYTREEYVKGRKEKYIEADGNNAKYKRAHGPMTARNCFRGSQYHEDEEEE
mmetsp:Transcript_11821/g.17793  ORF Transcript_11821/g.17793 Transcript_11821/m.17793 type:complete len:124 (-) Transcript_11821:36-407(-)